MSDNEPDLTFVDPHRRAVVADRIAAVKRFNRQPGRVRAEQEAEALGISTQRFYLVVKAWNTHRNAACLPGSNRHQMSTRVPDEIREEIARLIAENVHIKPVRVIKAVDEFCAAAGIKAPSGPTIASELNLQRRGQLPGVEQNVNYVIDHCHLTVPVAASQEITSVTMSAIIDVGEAAIVGLALTLDEPNAASTARALAHATAAGRLENGGIILMDRPVTRAWTEVAHALEAAGMTVEGEMMDAGEMHQDRGILRKRGNGRLLHAVAGRYIGGYTMRVRTRGSRSKPPVQRKAGAPPFRLEDAEKLIRERVATRAPDGELSCWHRALAGRLEQFSQD